MCKVTGQAHFIVSLTGIEISLTVALANPAEGSPVASSPKEANGGQNEMTS